jgi:methylisocitrate lyase
VFSQVEQIEQASRIANTISIPLIADGDTLGETVADAYHYTRRYIQQGIAGFHVEDERNPKHSKYVNGLWSIEDQQARIDAARRAQRDSDQDFVIIARCDELYRSEMGGGGTGSMADAIKRGYAYMEAGADVLFYPPRPDWVADLLKEFDGKHLIATMGFTVPGTAFNMLTGGWVTAAANHLKMMREFKDTGKMPSANFNFPEKYELINHPLYDSLIEEWANKTGRQSRPNHAP